MLTQPGKSLGQCRNKPPVISKDGGSEFPETHLESWCGELDTKEEE